MTTVSQIEEDVDKVAVIEVDVNGPGGVSEVRDPSQIYYMPIDPTPEMEAAMGGSEANAGFGVSERMLRDAWEFETEKKELFELRSIDTEIEFMIDSGLEAALEGMDTEQSTVSGIAVAVMKAMLSSHRALAKYISGPRRPEVRSSAEIQEELTGEYPRAVSRLICELLEAAERDSKNVRERRRGEVRKTVPRRRPWDGMPLPAGLPMDVMSRMTEEELEKTRILEPPFNVSTTSLMDATEHDEELEYNFSLSANCDEDTRIALRAALVTFLNAMNSPEADVCSLVVMMFKKFLQSHRSLASDFDFQRELVPNSSSGGMLT